jgi:hypothetical protein
MGQGVQLTSTLIMQSAVAAPYYTLQAARAAEQIRSRCYEKGAFGYTALMLPTASHMQEISFIKQHLGREICVR